MERCSSSLSSLSSLSSSLSLSSLCSSSSSSVYLLDSDLFFNNNSKINSDTKKNGNRNNIDQMLMNKKPGLLELLCDDRDSCAEEKKKQSHFLDVCFFCSKRLSRTRDIFMYRGDTPFCSEHCRDEQIERDEAKEKIQSLISNIDRGNKNTTPPPTTTTTKSSTHQSDRINFTVAVNC